LKVAEALAEVSITQRHLMEAGEAASKRARH
jgi:hypothetical protein